MIDQVRGIGLWHRLDDHPWLRLQEGAIIVQVGRVVGSSRVRREGAHLHFLAFEEESHGPKRAVNANCHQAEQEQGEGHPKDGSQMREGGGGMHDHYPSGDQDEKANDHTRAHNREVQSGERQRAGSARWNAHSAFPQPLLIGVVLKRR